MLKRLHVHNFTVFADADFEFGLGLNVVVGANGTGKSHVLKLAYAAELAYASAPREVTNLYSSTQDSLDFILAATVMTRLQEVFLANNVRQLVRRATAPDHDVLAGASIEAYFKEDGSGVLPFVILSKADTTAHIAFPQKVTVTGPNHRPVFIPAKEMLSLMPDIIGLSDTYADLFDLTYTALARLLVTPLLKKPPPYAQTVLETMGKLLGGTIATENGRFYLVPSAGERVEINLVAEGYRKLGTLAYLLANGSLGLHNTLYWDEPEANLNPALLRELAALLAGLAQAGFQIILATHSLFLLKEFHILAQQSSNTPLRYFSLNSQPSGATTVKSADNLELLTDIVALDAELDQSDRFQHVLDQEDADHI